MIRVRVDINGDNVITEIFAVRINPKTQPQRGEYCKYILYEGDGSSDRKKLCNFGFPYGDGVALSIEMLNIFNNYKNIQESQKERFNDFGF